VPWIKKAAAQARDLGRTVARVVVVKIAAAGAGNAIIAVRHHVLCSAWPRASRYAKLVALGKLAPMPRGRLVQGRPQTCERKGSLAPAKVVPRQAQNCEKSRILTLPDAKTKGRSGADSEKIKKAKSFLGFWKKTVLEYEALLIAAGFEKTRSQG
jgi:hypothetical protein